MSILSLFKPRAKKPEQKLRETRAMLVQRIAEAQAELSTSDDALWAMCERDKIISWKARIEQIDHLLIHLEWRTATGLEKLLREKFGVYNEIEASLAALPAFDEDEDDLDFDAMTSTERIQRKSVKQYHDRQFVIRHQLDLLARFAGVSGRRVYDVVHIIDAHYTDEDIRKRTQQEEAAAYYPVVRAWLNGYGSITALAIPTKFSDGMPEHPSEFPVLV